ncbi:MAG: S8 family serine peptidase, partial [Acidobacteria bacterium]|nr:S8 family serine peptidase [Acidobacteriota bacterium]
MRNHFRGTRAALCLLLAAPIPALAERSSTPAPFTREQALAAPAGPAAAPRTGLPPAVFGMVAGRPAPAPGDYLRQPHVLAFDAAWFDPLADGEPDLSRFVPDPSAASDQPPDAPRLALVQFDNAPGAPERAALAASGVEPLFHVPNDAYVVRADALGLARARGLAGVRWIGAYRAGYKVDGGLGRAAAGLVPAAPLPGERPDDFAVDLLVAPAAGRTAEDIAAELAGTPGVTVLAAGGDAKLGALTLRLERSRLREALAAVAAQDEVLAVEPHGTPVLHNDDAVWIGQSYDIIARRNYPVSATIWKRGLLGEGEVIAIADTGADPDVCWLEDSLGLPPPSQVPVSGAGSGPMTVDAGRRKIIGYNLLGSFQAQATPYDVRTGDPHGTWVAVAAAGDNPDHTASESNPVGNHHDGGDGMAPMAKLVIEDLGDNAGKLVGLGLPVPMILDAMFVQEREAGARISSNSWGSAGNAYDMLAFFTDRMVFEHPDFLVLFSAGNTGPLPGSLSSPGTAKNVVTVGASEARISGAENLDPENLAEFSARGPTSDGRLKPDLVMSGAALNTGTSDRAETGRTCERAQVNGTSFSTAVSAGFAALAREYYRKGYYPSGTKRPADGFVPSAALLKATLIAGAETMTGRAGADYGPCFLDWCDVSVLLCYNSFAPCDDDTDCWYCDANTSMACETDRDCDLSLVHDDAPATDQGWGRLHLDDALFFSGDARGLAVWDVARAEGLATGESWSSEVYLDGRSEDLQVVLTWPDPPSLTASPTYRVNDLDLRVVAPDGTEYWGNAWAPRDKDPFTREYTLPGTRPSDDVDVVEMVRVASYAAPAGVWRIEVVGTSVPGTPFVDGGARQDFAVVAVGPVAGTGGTLRFTSSRWACSGSVELELRDANASAPVSVTVGTASGDQETLALNAVGGGRFRGSLPVRSGAPLAAGNGQLEVADGEVLHASYSDAAPAHTATASAVTWCGSAPEAGPATITGGCDGDGFLDAGEQVEISIPLVNPGPADMSAVTARLVAGDSRLHVLTGDVAYGDIPAGAAAAPATPFAVSLREAAPRSSLPLWLELSGDGWTAVRRVEVALSLETDEVRTPGTWSEDFAAASGECYDGNPEPTPGSWYWFDLNKNCATTEPNWNLGFCYGDMQALLPTCTGQLVSTATARTYRLVSPQIATGAAGTTTILQSVRFREGFHFKLNQDGRRCERVVTEIYTNRDGRILPTGYYRDQNDDGSDEIAALDPASTPDWTLPPTPDATMVQLIFRVALTTPYDASTVCGGSEGDEVRWRVDNVELNWENIARVDDASACTPTCTAPAAPAAPSTAPAGGAVLVGWNPVPGADHYDVHRIGAAGRTFVARVPGSESSILDRPPGDGPWTWEIEAVDASGLCASAPASVSWGGAHDCRTAPVAPQGLAAADGASTECRVELSWDPVAPPCGGALAYRVYRSDDPAFEPSPDTLLAETAALAYTDLGVTTGWDARGEPIGEEWVYEVRALDPATGLEGPGTRAAIRPGGPRVTGTWVDGAGDDRPAKMVSEVYLDELGLGVGWSRSPLAVHHTGNWSYWSDPDPFGDGAYGALACFGLVSPPIDLDWVGSPQLSFWADYSIEWQFDGLVAELSVDGGAFAPITPVNGYPETFAQTGAPPCLDGGGTGDWINGCDYPPAQGCLSGPRWDGLSGWRRFVFDLSAYRGHRVRFRLNLSSDCGTDGGAVVDDLEVAGALLAPACA